MTLSDTKKTLKEEYRTKIGLSTIYRDFVYIGKKRKGALFYQRRKETPIGLDEFAKGKGHNYATLLMDLDKGKPVTATSGKTKAAIKDVLFNSGYDLSKIKVATMDMNDEARNVCKELLPQVKVVIDKFHLIRLVENIVNKQLLFLIDNWFPEIINYFDSKDTRITNGKTERKIGSFKRFQYARYHYKLLDNLNYYILGRES